MTELTNQMPASVSSPRKFEVSSRSVVAIAIPMTLAFITTPLLGLVDTAVVGRLGDPALLGGLAVGAILFDIVFTTLNFLRASTTGLVAQALGAGDGEEQRLVCLRSLAISLVCGILILLLSPLILWAGLFFMSVSPGVSEATSTYFSIRILAAPFTVVNYTLLGWLLGLGKAKTGLALQLVLNGTNIVLSLYLGLGLGWGLYGVGWATVAAEGIAALLGLLLFARAGGFLPFPDFRQLWSREKLIRLVAVNRDIMIRSFVLLFSFAFFTAQGARFGELQLAANAVLMNFFLISGYLLDGFATAAEQLAGKAIGARYKPAFDKAVRLTLVWGFALASVATAIFLFAGPALIDLLTTSEAVRENARQYLFWAAITALVGVVAFQMDGVFIGATWSQDMRNAMLISLAVYLASWAILTPWLGNHGLWISLNVFLGIRGITLWRRLKPRRKQAFEQG